MVDKNTDEATERPAVDAPGQEKKDAGVSARLKDGHVQLTQEELALVTAKYEELQKASISVFKRYQAAIREMRVRFEILDDDLELRYNRNPIHHIESRLKKPLHAFEKLQRYGKPITLQSLQENIFDIAGIRVICSYIDDVYKLVDMLESQSDLEIVAVKDYIAKPKPNGYRSLHVIVKVPIYFMDEMAYVPVEVQFRTIAMDFWASLEHTLRYKAKKQTIDIDMADELKNCSEIIEDVEERMQVLQRFVEDEEDLEES